MVTKTLPHTDDTSAATLAAQQAEAEARRDRAQAAVRAHEGELTRLEAALAGTDAIARLKAQLAGPEALTRTQEARLELAEAERECGRLHEAHRSTFHEPIRRRLREAYAALVEKVAATQSEVRAVLAIHEEAEQIGFRVSPGIPSSLVPDAVERWRGWLAHEGLVG